MASITRASISISSQLRASRQTKAVRGISSLKTVSFGNQRKNFSSFRMQPAPMRSCVSCAAKPETVEKVCDIVRKQLVLPDDSAVTGESTFTTLGADSLDTVEIVMELEEAFGISVEEDSAQGITTVQDAADLIEDLIAAKSAA